MATLSVLAYESQGCEVAIAIHINLNRALITTGNDLAAYFLKSLLLS